MRLAIGEAGQGRLAVGKCEHIDALLASGQPAALHKSIDLRRGPGGGGGVERRGRKKRARGGGGGGLLREG